MRENGIKAQYIKHRTRTTRDCDHSTKLHNILKRDFDPEKPNAAWCTDITYIWTQEDGFVYLTSIMDLYSRKIISWKLSKTMEVEDVLECLKIAKIRRAWIILWWSIRTVIQFVSRLYQELTKGMKCSYSRKGNPWDNACIESFHSLIKREWLNRQRIMNYEEAYNLVFEYVETFYNTMRIHDHCGFQSPNDYERNYNYQKNSIKCVHYLGIVPKSKIATL